MKSKQQILQAIDRIDAQLSPENLHCDGEISRDQAAAKARRLNAERRRLEQRYEEAVS